MKRLDPKKIRLIEGKTHSAFKQLQAALKSWKKDPLARSFCDNSILVLIKSKKMYQGQLQILDFWRHLRADGLQEVKFDIAKSVTRPADFLVATKSGYIPYDMVNFVFGSFVFTFSAKKKNPRIRPNLRIVTGNFWSVDPHQTACPLENFFLVLDL
jgi:hypothetical protein